MNNRHWEEQGRERRRGQRKSVRREAHVEKVNFHSLSARFAGGEMTLSCITCETSRAIHSLSTEARMWREGGEFESMAARDIKS